MKLKRTAKLAAKAAGLAALIFAVLFMVLNAVFPLPAGKLSRQASTAVFSNDGKLMKVYLSDDGFWRMKANLEGISPFMVSTVLEYEDKYFYWHPGVNLYSLSRAAIMNARSGRVLSGGSTITMQVARMMEPKDRTVRAKLLEIFRALQIEARYSKAEILEMYLNLAPYGGNIEGVAAAAYFYFGKPPDALSHAESISLAVLPNSPTRLRPDVNFQAFAERRQEIAARLLAAGAIGKREYQQVLEVDGPRRRTVPPAFAPHFSQMVKDRNPGLANIRSSIDLRIQEKCEKALAQHLVPLIPVGITNGAIVVIENSTRKVRALVGSRNFYDEASSGQVNGAESPRSPGSALKPFAYAVALERGLISPRMMLADVPVRYGSYAPVNYDEKFRGGVPAEEALKLSLNVPAVNLTAQLKGGFYSFLRSNGVSSLNRTREHYGLSIILGAGEVTLLEMTTLYSMLANGGEFERVSFLEDEKPGMKRCALSEATSYIITEILSDVRRPDLPNCWEFTTNMPKVAWKTGTSYGHRDAWSVGYNPEYTVGVWIGNFSGREALGLVGSEAAAPLLFELFHALSKGDKWFSRPSTVGIRKVCPLSGRPVSEHCPKTTDELYIYGVSPGEKCDMHKTVLVDNETGLRIAKNCAAAGGYTEKLFEVWPPKIATWMRREGFPVEDIPPRRGDCLPVTASGGPVIVSPRHRSEFFVRNSAPMEYQQILLDATVSNTVGELFWFVDGELLAAGGPLEKHFYTPTPGRHKITCMDNEGRSSSVTIEVLN